MPCTSTKSVPCYAVVIFPHSVQLDAVQPQAHMYPPGFPLPGPLPYRPPPCPCASLEPLVFQLFHPIKITLFQRWPPTENTANCTIIARKKEEEVKKEREKKKTRINPCLQLQCKHRQVWGRARYSVRLYLHAYMQGSNQPTNHLTPQFPRLPFYFFSPFSILSRLGFLQLDF